MTFTQQFLLKEFKGKIDTLNDKLAGFRSKLIEDPFNAFEWAWEEVEMSARWKVLTVVVRNLEKNQRWETILRVVHEEALRSAKYPPNSTSPLKNACHLALGAAWAEFFADYEKIETDF